MNKDDILKTFVTRVRVQEYLYTVYSRWFPRPSVIVWLRLTSVLTANNKGVLRRILPDG